MSGLEILKVFRAVYVDSCCLQANGYKLVACRVQEGLGPGFSTQVSKVREVAATK